MVNQLALAGGLLKLRILLRQGSFALGQHLRVSHDGSNLFIISVRADHQGMGNLDGVLFYNRELVLGHRLNTLADNAANRVMNRELTTIDFAGMQGSEDILA